MGNGSTNALVIIDPEIGATTFVGDTGAADIWGLSYADSKLYGSTSDGKFVTIDPNAGRGSAVSSIGGGWYGAATNPTKW